MLAIREKKRICPSKAGIAFFSLLWLFLTAHSPAISATMSPYDFGAGNAIPGLVDHGLGFTDSRFRSKVEIPSDSEREGFLGVSIATSPNRASPLAIRSSGESVVVDHTHAASAPEPATLLLFGSGLIALAVISRRLRKG